MSKDPKLFTFTLIGKGHVPYDMLRHGRCWPADPDAAMNMALIDDERRVTFKSMDHPNLARWASFGWRHVPGTPWRDR